MQSLQTNSGYILRLVKDEPIVESITRFCQEAGVHLASVQAIGAVKSAVVGFYPLEARAYHFREFNQEMELGSLTGNVSLLGNEPALHAHAVLIDTECRAFGGHLKEAIVAATCEVVITRLGDGVQRQFDETTGLNLWSLPA